MADDYVPKPNDVLVVSKRLQTAGMPEEPLLVLDASKGGLVSVAPMGKRPRSPRWMAVELIQRLRKDGGITVTHFVAPKTAMTRIAALTPCAQSEFNARVAAMGALLNSEDSLLLAYPDAFSRTCSRYAEAHGYKRKYIEKLAWMWLTRGRTESALVGDRGNSGGPGKKRGFSDAVPGPKQKDGPEYDVQAARPYSLEEREKLKAIAEQLWKSLHESVSQNEYWLELRKKAKALALLPPSYAQAVEFLADYKKRRKLANATGLIHRRYRGQKYASQEWEVDSTQLQAFTQSELDANVRLKNPVAYFLLEAKHDYQAAVYVTYEAPSPAVMAEVIFRALTGMGETCKEYGLPYTDEVFPPLPPGQKIWVDNQELTSPKLNNALLRHLGSQIEFAMVGKGADKGKVEGRIGKAKRSFKKNSAFFDKHSLGKALDKARNGTQLNLRTLEMELIKICYESNLRELPIDKLPSDFLTTGRPANRLEKFKWDLARTPELVRPIPPREQLACIVLPTKPYSVHAGNGIYINGRYYVCAELIADGLLRARAKGDTPQVEVAEHRGTTDFVYWVRGGLDFIKCVLHGGQEDAYGGMTASEAERHRASLPSQKKRERQRQLNSNAHQTQSQDLKDKKAASTSAKKGHITKDKKRIAEVRVAEVRKAAQRDAHRRFPEDVRSPDEQSDVTSAKQRDAFEVEEAEYVAKRLAERRNREQKGQ